MKNTFGNAVTLTLFGESHGNSIGAVLDGISPGISINYDYINNMLDQRKPSDNISTSRKETDKLEILSGVFNGVTTGTPICITFENNDTRSEDYLKTEFLARPSHADYTANCKYHGFEDFRGGGHFSGRITAPIVACGAIVRYALEQKGIYCGTHILECGGVSDRTFIDVKTDIETLTKSSFPVLDINKSLKMKEKILSAKKDGDSVGGILETVVTGVPAGVGEPWFDSVESMLAHSMFSIPGVKGIEFGKGFAFAKLLGSEANDSLRSESGKIYTKTNNNGGINGGITNGMDILFRLAVKPTPSIFKKQETIDLKTKENKELVINGRHDPAIIHRARAVVDSLTALTIADLLTLRYGIDYLEGGR